MSFEVIIILNVKKPAIEKTDFLFEQDKKSSFLYTEDNKFLNLLYSDAHHLYNDEELEMIKNVMGCSYYIWIIDTNSFSLLKNFILQLSFYNSFLIDNDYGSFLNVESFRNINSFHEFITTRNDY